MQLTKHFRLKSEYSNKWPLPGFTKSLKKVRLGQLGLTVDNFNYMYYSWIPLLRNHSLEKVLYLGAQEKIDEYAVG